MKAVRIVLLLAVAAAHARGAAAQHPARDNAPLRWTTAERAPRATLIFLHGLGDRPDNRLAREIVEGLRHQDAPFEVIAPWLRPEHGPHSMTDQLARASAIIEQTRGPVFLVGHSFGGKAAFELAERYPDRVRGVIGLSPSVRMLYSYWKGLTGERGLPAAERIRERLTRHDEDLRARLERATNGFERKSAREELEYLQTMRDLIGHDETRVESSVRTPTLVLHGTSDRAVSIHYARRFAEENGSIKLVEYSGVGHGFAERIATGGRGFLGTTETEPVTVDIARRIADFVRAHEGAERQ